MNTFMHLCIVLVWLLCGAEKNRFVQFMFTIYYFCWVITTKIGYGFMVFQSEVVEYTTDLLLVERSKFGDKYGIYYMFFGRSWNIS